MEERERDPAEDLGGCRRTLKLSVELSYGLVVPHDLPLVRENSCEGISIFLHGQVHDIPGLAEPALS